MANAVSRLLAARGWTDARLAARAHLDRAHLNQLKNGRALPTVATALAIAHALEVPVAVAFPPGTTARRRRARDGAKAAAAPTSAGSARARSFGGTSRVTPRA